MSEEVEDASDRGLAESASPPTRQGKAKSSKPTAKERLRSELATVKADRKRLKIVAAVLAALVVALALSTGAFALSRNSVVAEQTAEQSTRDRHNASIGEARKAVEGYTKRALTIDFRRAEEFVKGLSTGTTEAFGKTFSTAPGGAGALTRELLTQLRMVSEGEIVYSFVDGDLPLDIETGTAVNFVVVAKQTATTTQQPERTTTAVILRVVAVEVGGSWKIANFAPDPKVQGGDGSPVPGIG